jgi:ABC-type Fe3+/spermidine/putrescine transport system ATPase subunit
LDGFAFRLQTRTPDFLIDVSLDAGNELISLLGRRGSGKTVVLRSIAGVYTPQFGVIELGDRMVFSSIQGVDVPPSDRRVGWVPNANALFPNLTISENVAFALQKHESMSQEHRQQRVMEVLDMLELSGWHARSPAELPPEVVQRVCFARALAIDPDILLLDNPFQELEMSVRRKVRQEFRSLREAVKVPALFATVDLEEAYEISNRIALIEAGTILQVDSPRTLLMRPVSRQVADLTLSVNIGRGLIVEAVEGGVMVQTRLGRLKAAGIYSLGIDVDTVIRPEHIQVFPTGYTEYDDNLLHGTVKDVSRNGDLFDLRIVPETGGDPLHVSMSDLAFRGLGIGPEDQCILRFPPQAIHLMALLADDAQPSSLESGR